MRSRPTSPTQRTPFHHYWWCHALTFNLTRRGCLAQKALSGGDPAPQRVLVCPTPLTGWPFPRKCSKRESRRISWRFERKAGFGHLTQRIPPRVAVFSANSINEDVLSTSRPQLRNRRPLPSLTYAVNYSVTPEPTASVPDSGGPRFRRPTSLA